MRKFFYIILALSIFSSCSEYQKVMKNEEIAPKFKMGEELYNEGKYAKANKLFAQIVPSYRGKPQAEKLMYLYSMSFFKMKDYRISGYQMERFTSSYPKSEKVEEVSFLSAKSYYMLSPVFSKDQTETKQAIEKLQNFIDLYSDSEYREEANKLIKELGFKLEKKAYSTAMQYSRIAPGYTRDFTAAIKSFENFLFDFPGSILREDALFNRFDAAYKQAINSREYKNTTDGLVHLRKDRLEAALEYYVVLKSSYADSKYIEQANEMAKTIEQEIEKYSIKS